MKNVFITGASGLLGSHIVKQLHQKQYTLTVLVRSEQQAKIWTSLGIKTVIGDLEDKNFDLPKEINVIIHTAAIAGDWIDKTKAYNINVRGTEYLIEQALNLQCEKFIHVSTIGVYGHTKYMNATEDRPYKKSAVYEQTKILAEKLVYDTIKKHNTTKFIILRPSSMYGEGDRHILPKMEKYLKKGKFILIGGGNSQYPIIHATDAASAVILSLEKAITSGTTFNLCDDSKITMKEFVEILKENLQVEGELKSVPYLLTYYLSYLFELKGKITKKEPFIFRKRVKYLGVTRNVSIQKIKTELGFKPSIIVKDGIPLTLQSMKEEENYIEVKTKENKEEKTEEIKKLFQIIPFHLYCYLNQTPSAVSKYTDLSKTSSASP